MYLFDKTDPEPMTRYAIVSVVYIKCAFFDETDPEPTETPTNAEPSMKVKVLLEPQRLRSGDGRSGWAAIEIGIASCLSKK
jgi:hypothetical protein